MATGYITRMLEDGGKILFARLRKEEIMSDSRYKMEDKVLDCLPEAFFIQGVTLIAEVERTSKDGKKKYKSLYMRHARRNKLFKATVFNLDTSTKVIF